MCGYVCVRACVCVCARARVCVRACVRRFMCLFTQLPSESMLRVWDLLYFEGAKVCVCVCVCVWACATWRAPRCVCVWGGGAALLRVRQNVCVWGGGCQGRAASLRPQPAHPRHNSRRFAPPPAPRNLDLPGAARRRVAGANLSRRSCVCVCARARLCACVSQQVVTRRIIASI